jgi:uncharacterized protein (TIGR02466 family)
MGELKFLFPTPILTYNLDKKLLLDEYDSIGELNFTYAKKDYWGLTHKLYPEGDETFGGDVIKKHNLMYLHTAIDNLVEDYCNMLEQQKVPYRRTSWFTRCDRGDYGHIHTHGVADLSGVVYYEVPEGSGNIFFTSPVEAAKISGWFLKHHINNQTEEPEVGKLILFPGWLSHGVTTSESEQRRISLSFNIFFQRI